MLKDLTSLRDWLNVRGCRDTGGTELLAVQSRRLRALVRHAYERVPFYRERFDRIGLRPEDIKGVADLARLPVVRRREMQAAPLGTRLEMGHAGESVSRRTGGSAGRPLEIVTRREDLAYETQVWLRTWRRLGLRWRDRLVSIEASPDASPWRDTGRLRRLGWLDFRALDLHLGPVALTRQLEALRPQALCAPPSVLESIVRTSGGELPLEPRHVFSSGELLGAGKRRLLESRWAAPVHDCYSATEAGCIAWHCHECDAYHVNSDAVLVEVVCDGVPVPEGEAGEVLITNLFSRAMPFLRYSLGDRAQRGGSCPTAPAATTLRLLEGRTVSPIVTQDGAMLSPYSFMPDEIPGIDQYRVVQEAAQCVRVLVVPGRGFRVESLDKARSDYEARAGNACQVVFEICTTVEAGSGI